MILSISSRISRYAFKHISALLLWTLLIYSGFASANTLPNDCSREHHPNELTVFSYHEIAEKGKALDANYAVTPEHFEQQMKWLIDNGYHFVNVDDILNYRNHGKKLPHKAVFITFDDGYKVTYTNAFPILKKYKIPTVIALVGTWLLNEEKVDYNGKMLPRDAFLNQHELKEMIASGLVEVASHSYAYHKGILGNPQGNMQPALRTRQWLANKNKYEDEKSYVKRVENDLAHNSKFLKEYTGQTPRVMVWPYGHYNMETRKIAEKLGMPIGLTLDDGGNTETTPLWGLRRILVEYSMNLKDLARDMEVRNANLTDESRTTKAAHIDLDYIYDPDPIQQEKNLGDLLERIKKLNVNTIYLQAFADPDSDGAADYVYFPNRNIPMRADLFNRVSWQISTRTQVKRVYAWMPMMAWELPAKNKASKDIVVTLQVDPSHLNMGYPRLSPFSPRAKKVIKEIYEDLAKAAYIDGILFHDDVTLSDYEDNSKFAQAQYKKWGFSGDIKSIRSDREQFLKLIRLKTQYLDDFAMELAQILRNEQPGLKTARNLYAQVAINPNAQEWYAQSLSESIKYYDYTAIMAMPYMEQATNHKEFYEKIVHNVKQIKCGIDRTVIELQAVDWRKDSAPIPSEEMTQTISNLYNLGVHHIAYYPDNQFDNVPNADDMKKIFDKKSLFMNYLLMPTSLAAPKQ